jgi:hypothetical protein
VSDRRGQPRFDVIGSLWGVLELDEEARLRNVSTTGALLDSPLAMALDSVQTIRLAVDGHDVTVEARVRNVHQQTNGSIESRYVIGLEFIDPPLSVLQTIEQLSATISLDRHV